MQLGTYREVKSRIDIAQMQPNQAASFRFSVESKNNLSYSISIQMNQIKVNQNQ